MIFLCLIAVVVLYDQLILQEIAIVKRISVYNINILEHFKIQF